MHVLECLCLLSIKCRGQFGFVPGLHATMTSYTRVVLCLIFVPSATACCCRFPLAPYVASVAPPCGGRFEAVVFHVSVN